MAIGNHIWWCIFHVSCVCGKNKGYLCIIYVRKIHYQKQLSIANRFWWCIFLTWIIHKYPLFFLGKFHFNFCSENIAWWPPIMPIIFDITLNISFLCSLLRFTFNYFKNSWMVLLPLKFIIYLHFRDLNCHIQRL